MPLVHVYWCLAVTRPLYGSPFGRSVRSILRFDKLIVDGETFKYNDANDTVERIGSSRSRGRGGGNSGSQRLGASRGNDDTGTRASQGQDYYISSNSSTRGRVSNRRLTSEAGAQPIKKRTTVTVAHRESAKA